MQHLEKPSAPELPGLITRSRMEIVESLYEAERPIVFVTRTDQDRTLLGYVSDLSEDGTRDFLAPITRARLTELRQGALTVRDALTTSQMWQCLEADDGLHVWPVDPTSIPEIFLPAPGTPLLPEHTASIVPQARSASFEVTLGDHFAGNH